MGIKALKDEILKLSEAEQAELRAWLLHQDWDEWDREMAEDFALRGRGEHLLRQAQENSAPALQLHSQRACVNKGPVSAAPSVALLFPAQRRNSSWQTFGAASAANS
jgi:hypothetical protein